MSEIKKTWDKGKLIGLSLRVIRPFDIEAEKLACRRFGPTPVYEKTPLEKYKSQ